MSDPIATREHIVCRLYDAAGRLLYVGSPESPSRLRAHPCLGSWMKDIHRAHVQPLHNFPAKVLQ